MIPTFKSTDPKGKEPIENPTKTCPRKACTPEGKTDRRACSFECGYNSTKETPISHYDIANEDSSDAEDRSSSLDQSDEECGVFFEDPSLDVSKSRIIFPSDAHRIYNSHDAFSVSITEANWMEINTQLTNNDPSITSLNMSFALSERELDDLNNALEKNKALGFIEWHKDQKNYEFKKQIENKLVDNNKNYRQHPDDFIHILLSKHVYKDSQIGDHVQLGPQFDVYLANWKVKKIYDDTNTSGYYAVIYKNKNDHQVVLAIRGTEGGGAGVIKSLLKKNSDWKTNLEEILGGQIVIGQQARNYQATYEAIKIAKAKKYRLSFTGHSLGAWLAELSVFYSHVYFKHYKVKAVTFDSPGALPMMEKLQPNIVNRTNVELTDLKIVTYLATPNPVNCCNSHVGEVFCIKVDMKRTDYANKKMPDFIKNGIGDKVEGILAIEGHGLSKMLAEFDPQTARPKKCIKMADWPRMEYYGEEKDFASKAIDLMQMGIKKGVGCIDFTSSLASTIASKTIGACANWLVGDKTLMTIIGFLKSVITDEVNQDQYWAYFEHINLQGSDAEHSKAKIKKNFDHKFGLNAEAHFREEKDASTCILSLQKGSTDKHLYNLYNYQINLNHSSNLPKSVKDQLSVLLSFFTIKQLDNNRHLLIPQKGHNVEHIKQIAERLFQVVPMDRFHLFSKVVVIEKIVFKYYKGKNKKYKSKVQDDLRQKHEVHKESRMSGPQQSFSIAKPQAENEDVIDKGETVNSATIVMPKKSVPSSMAPNEDRNNARFSSIRGILAGRTGYVKKAAEPIKVVPNEKRQDIQLIVYEIDNLEKLNTLQTLFTNGSNQSNQDFLETIKELRFASKTFGYAIGADIKDSFEQLLNTLSENEELLPNFESMHINGIVANIKIDFPMLAKLKKLDIKKIGRNVSLNLALCEELESFAIVMNRDAKLTLATTLDQLKTLTIKDIWNSQITLPNNRLKNLTSLTIGNISIRNQIFLPVLDSLKDLTLRRVNDYSKIQFSNTLSTVQTLTIERVGHQGPSAIVEGVFYLMGATSLQRKPDFGFLSKFTGLTSLSMNSIENDTILELPKLKDTLKTLSIGFIERNVKINPSRIFRHVKTLSIESIGTYNNNANFELPNSFHHLSTLSINSICKGSTLKIPNSLPKLNILSIKTIDGAATLKIPVSFPQHAQFTVNSISKRAKLDLSWSMNSQKKKDMETIWSEAVR